MVKSILDCMFRVYRFRCTSEIHIQDPQERKNERPLMFQGGSLVWYIDGLAMGGNAGMGIYGPRRTRLSNGTPTIFQGEINNKTKQKQTLRIGVERNLQRTRTYTMMNSQAAIKVMSS